MMQMTTKLASDKENGAPNKTKESTNPGATIYPVEFKKITRVTNALVNGN